jgi:uncharacterized PurR-regulated membrane protein YhhQ (DUF165 family)
MLYVLFYILTIPLSNLLIQHMGTICAPHQPCLIPIFPGVMAPSGVLVVGAGLLLRDLLQRRYGAKISLAPPALALASGMTFLLSEFTDFLVYTYLVRRSFILAIILSCIAGAVVDSIIFLWIAFGSLNHVEGMVIGKTYAMIFFTAYTFMVKNKKKMKKLNPFSSSRRNF